MTSFKNNKKKYLNRKKSIKKYIKKYTKRSAKKSIKKQIKNRRKKSLKRNAFGSFFSFFTGKKKTSEYTYPVPYLNNPNIQMGLTNANENPDLKTALFIVDPQNDFVTDSESAISDMINLVARLKKYGSKISDIFVSLDMHNTFGITNSMFWVNNIGAHPTPGTVISKQDVLNGTWRTLRPEFQEDALEYIEDLEVNK